MRRAIVIALVLVVAAFAVEIGGFGGPMVIGLLPNYDDLNAELASYNTEHFGGTSGPEFSGPMILLGGQGKGLVEGFTVGGWGGGFFKETNGDSSKAILGYGMGYADFGYHFNIANILLIGPSLQLGGGGMGLHIGRFRSGAGFGDPSDGLDNEDFFDDDESYDVGKGFVSVGASADVTLLFPMNERKTVFGGITVKAGYLYPVYESDWWDEHGSSIDKQAVDFNMDGPYASVGVVFGGSSVDYDEDEEWEEW
jgi:hypothetical protein